MAGTRDIAGRRYAHAIIEMAREDGDFDAWGESVEALGALTADPRYVAALQSDGMTDEKFQQLVRRVLPTIGQKQLNLFRLLRRKSRLELGPSIASFFADLLDEQRGIARATVTTAVELTDEQRSAVERWLTEQTGKQVVLETRVDPAVLGGIVVRIGDQLLDATARTRLRALRSRLERAAL